MSNKALKKRADLTDAEMVEIFEKAWEKYNGDVSILMSAMGALAFGRMVGWQGVRVTMAASTFRKYERILGVKFREKLPDRTTDSRFLHGIKLVDGFGKFWQALSGGMIPATEGKMTVQGT